MTEEQSARQQKEAAKAYARAGRASRRRFRSSRALAHEPNSTSLIREDYLNHLRRYGRTKQRQRGIEQHVIDVFIFFWDDPI